jgi:hypothetical protein
MRDGPSGSPEVILRISVEALTPKRAKATAAREPDFMGFARDYRVAIYNHNIQKLYEWRVGEEPP